MKSIRESNDSSPNLYSKDVKAYYDSKKYAAAVREYNEQYRKSHRASPRNYEPSSPGGLNNNKSISDLLNDGLPPIVNVTSSLQQIASKHKREAPQVLQSNRAHYKNKENIYL